MNQWHWRDVSKSPTFLRIFHWTGAFAAAPPVFWFRDIETLGVFGGFMEAAVLSGAILLIAFIIQTNQYDFLSLMRYVRRRISSVLFSKRRHAAPFSLSRRRRH